MAIKFGDLLENINPNRAVLDLIQNNAKGVLFVSSFDDQATTNNQGVAGIPLEKRGIGSLVCETTTGDLYCYTGGGLTVQVVNSVGASNGFWDDVDVATREWVQIGQVPVRDTLLKANISSGPALLDVNASLGEVISTVNDLINNPPRSFGRFLSQETVVADGESLTALQIIVRALSQILDYDAQLTITSGGTIEFGQNTGTVGLSFQITSVNYDLLNQNGENIEPVNFDAYYRVEGGQWTQFQNQTYLASDFTSVTSDPIKTISFGFNPTILTSQYSTSNNIDFKVEVRDNSDEGDLSGASGASGLANPIRAISNTVTASTSSYVNATGSLTQVAANNEQAEDIGQPDNWSSILRSKGNFGTDITWSLASNPGNGYVTAAALIPINSYNIQKRVMTSGSWGNWSNLQGTETTSVSGDAISQTGQTLESASGSFRWTGVNTDINTCDAVQFRIVYSDASGATSATVTGTTSPEINFRYVIFGGFADVGFPNGAFTAAQWSTVCNETLLESLTLTTRGWSAGDSTIVNGHSTTSYGSSSNSGASFPRLDAMVGYYQDTDNIMPDYLDGNPVFAETNNASGTSQDGSFGWAYNSGTQYSGNGVGDTSTRLIFAVPDDSLKFAPCSNTFPNGNAAASVSVPSIQITNSFGSVRNYKASAMDTAGAMTNVDGSFKNLIKLIVASN